jgi:hypothetical protein
MFFSLQFCITCGCTNNYWLGCLINFVRLDAYVLNNAVRNSHKKEKSKNFHLAKCNLSMCNNPKNAHCATQIHQRQLPLVGQKMMRKNVKARLKLMAARGVVSISALAEPWERSVVHNFTFFLPPSASIALAQ